MCGYFEMLILFLRHCGLFFFPNSFLVTLSYESTFNLFSCISLKAYYYSESLIYLYLNTFNWNTCNFSFDSAAVEDAIFLVLFFFIYKGCSCSITCESNVQFWLMNGYVWNGCKFNLSCDNFMILYDLSLVNSAM